MHLAAGLPGGLGDEQPADDHVRGVVASVKDQIQKKFPREYLNIEPISYRTQVVAGRNYFVKVSAFKPASTLRALSILKESNSDLELVQLLQPTNTKVVVTEKDNRKSHAHLRIYRSFRGDHELTAIKMDVDKDTPLKYFQ